MIIYTLMMSSRNFDFNSSPRSNAGKRLLRRRRCLQWQQPPVNYNSPPPQTRRRLRKSAGAGPVKVNFKQQPLQFPINSAVLLSSLINWKEIPGMIIFRFESVLT